ncbi:hypothetical protein [Nocardia sp. alder85J]|uniref:hypothetical protein n=1 Tax=Nocardia sp. alder85J TaxID=2862949 RepID=UPI001CD1FB2C|nr:hypothetical protein [Nocardia sp. alder85J]MCX4095308.1 hypothetical protein [Nocardia sp. alder85J]
MSSNRQSRQCYRQYRPRQAAVRRELTLHSGADLAGLPPLIRIARCITGKVQYFTAADAELALAGIDHSDPRRREQRVYRCPDCQGWHLTSQD